MVKGVSRVDNAITEVVGGELKRKVGCEWMMGQTSPPHPADHAATGIKKEPPTDKAAFRRVRSATDRTTCLITQPATRPITGIYLPDRNERRDKMTVTTGNFRLLTSRGNNYLLLSTY
ncbi:hypothetical protein An03g04240 [Aspergillus niger]|uniref:Uncharacterized protein n=2 Tax=Aspergillus niger TaxID=5061 RepID=A2QGR6_ASPNC|nr:hypothetical protein An03g04240 [Aspergillus niger]CAK47863.1 hypothetical protein An03g04240 [Aspergillus niger]